MSKAMLKKFCLSLKSRILKGHMARVTKTGQFSKPAGTLDHFLRWPLASTVFGANKKWSILWCRDPVSMLSLLFIRELRASKEYPLFHNPRHLPVASCREDATFSGASALLASFPTLLSVSVTFGGDFDFLNNCVTFGGVSDWVVICAL